MSSKAPRAFFTRWRTVASRLAWLACGACSAGGGAAGSTSDGGTAASSVASASDGGSAAQDAAASCGVSAPAACTTPTPTYAEVSPVFAARCASCHSGAAGGPWPLDSYTTISDWRNEIRASLVDCSMPPADAGATLTDDERSAIVNWLNCGAPR